MKKLTLSQKNLDFNQSPFGICDFCEESDKQMIAGKIFNYKDETNRDCKFNPLICGDCVRQLANLIK